MVIVIDVPQFAWTKDGMIEGGDYVRAADVAGMLRDVAKALDPKVSPPVEPPVDPDPVEPPVEPPRDPWTHVAQAGAPAAAGWYATLTPEDGETAAHPHYWDGAQWLWAPNWFPSYVAVDRYQGPIDAPVGLLKGTVS